MPRRMARTVEGHRLLDVSSDERSAPAFRWRGRRQQEGIPMKITKTRAPRAPDDAVRLRMDPVPSRTTVIDGAWWPRSTDAVAELPALVEALAGLRGRITHILMNSGEWDLPHPRRAAA